MICMRHETNHCTMAACTHMISELDLDKAHHTASWRQIIQLSLCGMVYVPWHKHHIEVLLSASYLKASYLGLLLTCQMVRQVGMLYIILTKLLCFE